jgi:hypothetical protein
LQQNVQGNVKRNELELQKERENDKEDRKDKRTKIQASQQSKMIQQRKQDLNPIDFNEEDSLGGMDELFNV